MLEEPENGETGLAPHIPLQLLHLPLDHQVNRFMGCDCHIETSYRCEGHVRGWITAKNPASRFVLLTLVFVLLNVWLHLRWRFTPVPQCGGRWLETQRFPLLRFVKFLQRALEAWYGCIQTITAPALPRE